MVDMGLPWPMWLAGLVLLALYVWSIVWACGDAKARGKPAWAVGLIVALLSWPLGLLLWIVFRPARSP